MSFRILFGRQKTWRAQTLLCPLGIQWQGLLNLRGKGFLREMFSSTPTWSLTPSPLLPSLSLANSIRFWTKREPRMKILTPFLPERCWFYRFGWSPVMCVLKGTQDNCDSNVPHTTVWKKHCFKQILGTISEGIWSHFSWQFRKVFLGHTRTILWEDDASGSSQSHSARLETHQAFSSLHENIHTSFPTQPIYCFLCVSPCIGPYRW